VPITPNTTFRPTATDGDSTMWLGWTKDSLPIFNWLPRDVSAKERTPRSPCRTLPQSPILKLRSA
jgi:hypothetical protein